MAGGSLYSSDVNVPAGKKAKFSMLIDKQWFIDNKITSLKKINITFWGYYDNCKEWEATNVEIVTTQDNTTGYFSIDNNPIYSDDNIDVYYIEGDNNEYTFCIKNKNSYEYRYTIENCSVNDWAYDLGSCKYDLYSEAIMENSYAMFTLVVDTDFLTSNDITSISNIEFDIELNYNTKTDKITLDL